jgi:hypothetical protein
MVVSGGYSLILERQRMALAKSLRTLLGSHGVAQGTTSIKEDSVEGEAIARNSNSHLTATRIKRSHPYLGVDTRHAKVNWTFCQIQNSHGLSNMLLKRYPVRSDKAQISMYAHFETRSKLAGDGGIADSSYDSSYPSERLCGCLEPQATKMAPALVAKRNPVPCDSSDI